MQKLTLLIFVLLATGCVYLEGAPAKSEQEDEILKQIDDLIERGEQDHLNKARELLLEACKKFGKKAAFLWRLASCYFHFSRDLEQRVCAAGGEALTEKGYRYAEEALELDPTDSDVHKWFALMTVRKSIGKDLNERGRCAIIYKKHLDIAMEIRPDDPTLFYLIGVYQYEVAKLSWLVKKMASVFFGEIPDATLKMALQNFLHAISLSEKPSKANSIYLAKCYLKDGDRDEASRWLDEAERIEATNSEDRRLAPQIPKLRTSLK